MSLKQFSIKFLVFIILLFMADQFAGVLFRKLESKAGDKYARENYIRYIMNEDIIIMGSSKATYHYVPNILSKELKMSVYNCGQKGNGIIYEYGRLETIYKRYHPKIIIMDVIKGYDLEKNDNSRYLDFLKIDYGTNKSIDSLFYAVDKYSKYKMLLNCYRYNSTLCDLLINYFYRSRNRFSDDGYSALHGSKIKTSVSQKTEKNDMNDVKMEIDPIKIKYLKKIVLDKPKECFMIFVLSPSMYEKSVDYNCVKQICKQNNILFLDYSNDNRFVGKEYLFYDYVHLNEFGAKKFSKILASDIKEFLTNNHINITN